MRQKTKFQIFGLNLETHEKFLIATVNSQGNTHTCFNALRNVYPPDKYKLTIE